MCVCVSLSLVTVYGRISRAVSAIVSQHILGFIHLMLPAYLNFKKKKKKHIQSIYFYKM